jgi:hypothetical protein
VVLVQSKGISGSESISSIRERWWHQVQRQAIVREGNSNGAVAVDGGGKWLKFKSYDFIYLLI